MYNIDNFNLKAKIGFLFWVLKVGLEMCCVLMKFSVIWDGFLPVLDLASGINEGGVWDY